MLCTGSAPRLAPFVGADPPAGPSRGADRGLRRVQNTSNKRDRRRPFKPFSPKSEKIALCAPLEWVCSAVSGALAPSSLGSLGFSVPAEPRFCCSTWRGRAAHIRGPPSRARRAFSAAFLRRTVARKGTERATTTGGRRRGRRRGCNRTECTVAAATGKRPSFHARSRTPVRRPRALPRALSQKGRK